MGDLQPKKDTEFNLQAKRLGAWFLSLAGVVAKEREMKLLRTAAVLRSVAPFPCLRNFGDLFLVTHWLTLAVSSHKRNNYHDPFATFAPTQVGALFSQ